MHNDRTGIWKVILLTLEAGVIILGGIDFYNIAWGTGIWLGQFSLLWFLIFVAFVAFCLFLFLSSLAAVWRLERIAAIERFFLRLRVRLGFWNWLLASIVLGLPVWLLQYTPWGIVIHGTFLRLFLWGLDAFLLSVLLGSNREQLLDWRGTIVALLLSGASFALVVPFQSVTSYPFSLGWSEGNRLYDYSIMFGRSRYIYPTDQPLSPFLDVGRQFAGGLPYLFPGLTITMERFWAAFVYIGPYLILGWLAFRIKSKNKVWPWVLAGLWVGMFLRQGPIHPPLVASAILVALAWGGPFWLAGLLVFGAAYIAEVSRFTWVFAAPIWIGMLELGGASLDDGKLSSRAWGRSIGLGVAGLLGGLGGPRLVGWIQNLVKHVLTSGSEVTGALPGGLSNGLTVTRVTSAVSVQPLLWYRLLPNATYGAGILAGLLIAVLPLILLLITLHHQERWNTNFWQKFAIVLPLLAFLGVGLVVSVKIGGGGDLHNLDMFLIGLVFTAAIAWRKGGWQWIAGNGTSLWARSLLLLMIVIPAYGPLMDLRPLNVSGSLERVATLADIDNPQRLQSLSLPSAVETKRALKVVKDAVAAAHGEVLFMDQRQLLTFQYVRVPLIPDYDKKVLINEALSSDQVYFDKFYHDLATRRFALIISSPLHAAIQDQSYGFSDENNAWAKWVAAPILCYYRPINTIKSVQVQLLVPAEDTAGCAAKLP